MFCEKVKLGKFSMKAAKFFGNRGKSETGGMHHCLRGDGRPCHDPSISKSGKSKSPRIDAYASVAVLGFCGWGANGAGIFVWGAKEGLSAEGKKPLTTKGPGGAPQACPPRSGTHPA